MFTANHALAAAPIDVKVDGFTDKYAQVNGVRLHYKIGGSGTPVLLLHGYAQTGHMWVPAMRELVKNHTVIVPDLRGAGGEGVMGSEHQDSGSNGLQGQAAKRVQQGRHDFSRK